MQAKGVDSIGGGFANPARFVRDLARRESALPVSSNIIFTFLMGIRSGCMLGCIIVLTGVVYCVSDGETVIKLSNGNALLGKITGSGCMVGTSVATFCAGASLGAREARSPEDAAEDGRLVKGDMLLAAVGGSVML